MNKQQKQNLLEALRPLLGYPHVYVTACEGLNGDQMYRLRKIFHGLGVVCRLIPNALLHLLYGADARSKELAPAFSGHSLLFLIKDNPEAVAKAIKAFRAQEATDKPILKRAWVYEELFEGDALDALTQLRSREELIGEIAALLQMPAQQLLEAVHSGSASVGYVLQHLAQAR